MGDTFKASAPYGDFQFRPKEGRLACFICTGTGIGPIKSILDSRHFHENPPDDVKLVFGAANASEVIFPGYFEAQGIQTVTALSQENLPQEKPRVPSKESSAGSFYPGRVTTYLKDPDTLMDWRLTEFYLCGNGAMIQEANRILQGRGVRHRAIHKEAYFAPYPHPFRTPGPERSIDG